MNSPGPSPLRPTVASNDPSMLNSLAFASETSAMAKRSPFQEAPEILTMGDSMLCSGVITCSSRNLSAKGIATGVMVESVSVPPSQPAQIPKAATRNGTASTLRRLPGLSRAGGDGRDAPATHPHLHHPIHPPQHLFPVRDQHGHPPS